MTIHSPEAAFPLVSPIVTRLFAINVQKKVKHTHKGQTQNKQEGKLPQTDRASDFGRKSQIFPNLRIKRPPLTEFSWTFIIAVGVKKTRVMPYQVVGRI